MSNRQDEHQVPLGIDRKDDAPIANAIPASPGQFPRQQLYAVVTPWLPLQLYKAAGDFLRKGAVDCGKEFLCFRRQDDLKHPRGLSASPDHA